LDVSGNEEKENVEMRVLHKSGRLVPLSVSRYGTRNVVVL
jgi:hypothetical protein